jgi:hypothetical protein
MLRTKRAAPTFYPKKLSSALQTTAKGGNAARRVLLFVPLLAIVGVLINSWFNVADYDYSGLWEVDDATPSLSSTTPETVGLGLGLGLGLGAVDKTFQKPHDWCNRVQQARAALSPSLHIQYPCEPLNPAKSAIVCMLTDGVSQEKASNVVFTANNYIHGAMALGASLMEQIDRDQTHMLLLLRDGFVLPPDDRIRLQSVGWTIGTAPEFPLPSKYLPRFPRYKTTYTKVMAIGLAEYDCVLLMDADTLAVGDLREIMTCSIFTEPQQRVAGTLDWYRGRWYFFNTGSLLWRPNAKEMERVFHLALDDSFMKRYSSDQEFLNYVYPERLNKTLNNRIAAGDHSDADAAHGQVVTMPWEYNAQTHVEVERVDYWEDQRPSVKILHFTQKKGWQCEERHGPPPPLEEMPQKCDKDIPICYCREAHLYWNALTTAHTLANQTMEANGR